MRENLAEFQPVLCLIRKNSEALVLRTMEVSCLLLCSMFVEGVGNLTAPGHPEAICQSTYPCGIKVYWIMNFLAVNRILASMLIA